MPQTTKASVNQQLINDAHTKVLELLKNALESAGNPKLFKHGINKIGVSFELANAVAIALELEGPATDKPEG